MEISEFSKTYQVRRLGRDDVDAIYELCRENRIFYRYHEPFVTKESILDDMEALPPGKSREDKYYVGFFDGGSGGHYGPDPGLSREKNCLHRPVHDRRAVSAPGRGFTDRQRACGVSFLLRLRKIRLGVDKGNPQSHAFWTKNRFQTIGEARYIVMEREI